MKIKTWLAIGMLASLAASAIAEPVTRTFRSPAGLSAVIQTTDIGGKPAYDFEGFAGHDLVNLALGTPLSTVRTNEVLAFEVSCDSGSAALVVYDKAASSNIATIATSSRIDVVQQQDNDASAFPNRERFVALLDFATSGTSSNGITGGYLTVAGRLHLNPVDGCPRAVLVDTDRRYDKFCGDTVDPKNLEEKKVLKSRAGRGHFIGVIDMISLGNANTVLVPAGSLGIQRQLLP